MSNKEQFHWQKFEKSTKSQKPEVKELGLRIGFGNLMHLAATVWEEELNKNWGLSGGSFTVGPCKHFMVPCEHWGFENAYHCDWCCGIEMVTKHVANIAKQQTHSKKEYL